MVHLLPSILVHHLLSILMRLLLSNLAYSLAGLGTLSWCGQLLDTQHTNSPCSGSGQRNVAHRSKDLLLPMTVSAFLLLPGETTDCIPARMAIGTYDLLLLLVTDTPSGLALAWAGAKL